MPFVNWSVTQPGRPSIVLSYIMCSHLKRAKFSSRPFLWTIFKWLIIFRRTSQNAQLQDPNNIYLTLKYINKYYIGDHQGWGLSWSASSSSRLYSRATWELVVISLVRFEAHTEVLPRSKLYSVHQPNSFKSWTVLWHIYKTVTSTLACLGVYHRVDG